MRTVPLAIAVLVLGVGGACSNVPMAGYPEECFHGERSKSAESLVGTGVELERDPVVNSPILAKERERDPEWQARKVETRQAVTASERERQLARGVICPTPPP